jgi:hypothetical protein
MTIDLPIWQPPVHHPTIKRLLEPLGLRVEQLTCYDCAAVFDGCEFAFDPYNTDGDCLADK